MAIKDKNTLKGYFNTGNRPTQSQFEDLIDTVVVHTTASSVKFDNLTVASAAVPANFTADKYIEMEANGTRIYVPVRTSAW